MNEKRSWTKDRRDDVVREIERGFMVILQFPWCLLHLFQWDSLCVFIIASLSICPPLSVSLAHEPNYPCPTTPFHPTNPPHFLLCFIFLHSTHHHLTHHRFILLIVCLCPPDYKCHKGRNFSSRIFTSYLKSLCHVSTSGQPLGLVMFALLVLPFYVSLNFFSETIRRKVVHHFGADP